MRIAQAVFTASVIVLVILGLFAGSALSTLSQSTQPKIGPSTGGGTYALTMIITDGNWFNGSVMYQPSFFVLQNGELISAASISIPADTAILLTVVNYDNGTNAISQAVFANAKGVTNDSVFVAGTSGLTMNDLEIPAGIPLQLGGQNTTTFPAADISHTFTVISANTYVNIPIIPNSIETTTFALPPGSYIWQCQCACGWSPDGWGGAMGTDGWMSGIVNVG